VVYARAGFLTIVLGAALLACSPAPGVPGPIEVPLENSEQAVVDQLTRLLAQARAEPRSARSRAVLGMAYEMSGRLQAAHGSYAQAAGLEPGEPRWSYLEAVAQAELGDLEGALSVLDRSIALDGDYAPSHLFRGQWLLDLGRLEEAGEAFSRAAKLETRHPAPRIGIAKVLLRAGRAPEALPILEKLLRERPEDPHLNQLIGQAYRSSGDLERARAALALASPGNQPRWPDPWRDERFEYQTGFAGGMFRTSKLMKQGRTKEALALMEQLREQHPDDRQLLNNLSVAYRASGQADRAFEVLLAGLEHHPDYFPFHLNISSDYQRMGDTEQALDHLRKVVEIKPTLAEGWERIGSIHFAGGDMEAALAAFEQAARSDPGSTQYLLYCGIILGRLGRWDEAVERLQRALEIDPNPGPVLVSLGQALAEAGRFDESRETLARAAGMKVDRGHLERAQARLAQLEAGGR
jgi:tetratricopeptide (TPR) repeat protein